MFNDDFLEEEYANLPNYEGTEMLPVRQEKNEKNEKSRLCRGRSFLPSSWLHQCINLLNCLPRRCGASAMAEKVVGQPFSMHDDSSVDGMYVTQSVDGRDITVADGRSYRR